VRTRRNARTRRSANTPAETRPQRPAAPPAQEPRGTARGLRGSPPRPQPEPPFVRRRRRSSSAGRPKPPPAAPPECAATAGPLIRPRRPAGGLIQQPPPHPERPTGAGTVNISHDNRGAALSAPSWTASKPCWDYRAVEPRHDHYPTRECRRRSRAGASQPNSCMPRCRPPRAAGWTINPVCSLRPRAYMRRHPEGSERQRTKRIYWDEALDESFPPRANPPSVGRKQTNRPHCALEAGLGFRAAP